MISPNKSNELCPLIGIQGNNNSTTCIKVNKTIPYRNVIYDKKNTTLI